MKIKINYDLLSKIQETNTGSLQKTVKTILLKTGITMTIIGVLDTVSSYSTENLLNEILGGLGICLTIHTSGTLLTNLMSSKLNKIAALKDLMTLSLLLNNININTNFILLLKSYKYKTEYKINSDEDSNHKLVQKKYIMVPVHDSGEEKEISLVQEHVIGTKEYSLSYGSPKKAKVLRLALNPM